MAQHQTSAVPLHAAPTQTLNLQLARSSLALLRLCFPSSSTNRKWRSPASLTSAVLLCLIASSLVEQLLITAVGSINGTFFQLLTAPKEGRDALLFRSFVARALLVILLIALFKSLSGTLVSFLALLWRRRLTEALHGSYFRPSSFYRLNQLSPSLDNPDQRIVQDVERFTTSMSSLLNRVLIVPFQVVYYSYACGQLLGYMAPLLIYSFFVVATAVNKLLADPVLPLVVSQEASEAHFRHFHARVRANAESVAFQDGEKAEGTRASIHLGHLYNISKAVILRRLFVQCSSEFFVYSGAILNYVLIALPIFAGDYDHIDSSMLAKHISQSSFYTLYLIHSFTTIIALWSDICLVGGYTSRLAQLFQHSKSVGKDNSLPHLLGPDTGAEDEEGKEYNQMKVWNEQAKQEDIRLLEAGGYVGRMESCFVDADVLGFAGATCCTPFPPFVCLVKELDLEVKAGVNVLIEGPSGCGKSSLLRVLKGLWPITSGHVLRPKNEEEVLFFLPQMPYVFPGTLWELIAYPSLFNSSSATTRLHLEEALAAACLQDLSFRLYNGSFSSSSFMLNNTEAKMMNGNNPNEEIEEMAASVVVDWEQVLSPGERQRIGMARLFFHRPRFAVLDEATSALSLQQEASVYARCGEMGMTLLSVGHRPSLRRFHHFLLRIETNDGEMNHEKEEDEKKEKGQEGEMEKGTPMNSIRRRTKGGEEGGKRDKLRWVLAPIHHG